MACRAAAGAIEVRLAGSGIADDDVEDLVEAAVRILVDRRVQERREIRHLCRRQIEFRHSLVRTPGGEKVAELLPALVVLNDRRPRQIGTTRPAARIRAVAKAALIDQQLLPALDGRGIGHGRERLLLGSSGYSRNEENREN